MPRQQPASTTRGPTVEAYLLGRVDFRTCLALQQRLVYEAAGRKDGQISLLICEHPLGITIGRQGSRAHLRIGERELASRDIDVRWVNRGGGCLMHGPGQLAVYPIVPLETHGLSVGAYLNRLQAGLLATLNDVTFQGQTRPGCFGIWGRAGQVVAVGVAVKNWISYFGAYINVDPEPRHFRFVHSDPLDGTPMTTLVAERQHPVRMTMIRESVVRQLSAALGCDRYHLYTGHPLLTTAQSRSELASRVG